MWNLCINFSSLLVIFFSPKNLNQFWNKSLPEIYQKQAKWSDWLITVGKHFSFKLFTHSNNVLSYFESAYFSHLILTARRRNNAVNQTDRASGHRPGDGGKDLHRHRAPIVDNPQQWRHNGHREWGHSGMWKSRKFAGNEGKLLLAGKRSVQSLILNKKQIE